MNSAAISGVILPFISAGIAPMRVSARKLRTVSAAAVAHTATGSRLRMPRAWSHAARASTRVSSSPSVNSCSAGLPSTSVSKMRPGPPGSAPWARTVRSTLPAPISGSAASTARKPFAFIVTLLFRTELAE
jgi:hypothetical protein